MADLIIDVITNKLLVKCDGKTFPCAIGRSGAIDAADKREGDGTTPKGTYPPRYLYWRPDRLARPETEIAAVPLTPEAGWCDDVADHSYNRPVTLPYAASSEALWREDHIYDVILVIGHNDEPPVAPLGSAIFFHLARENYAATEGCVALAKDDFLKLLSKMNAATQIRII
jgi:L,D-peptidoglycan transpeptidase YkuD (ErfK/YbiS/YcfS/YnhG family)